MYETIVVGFGGGGRPPPRGRRARAYRRSGVRARLTDGLADLAVLTGDADARTEAVALADELGMKAVTACLPP